MEAAIQDYHNSKKQDPNYRPFDERFLMDKGYAYLDGGKVEDAKKIFALNIESHPTSWQVYNNLAEAHSKSGERDSAVLLYKKSLELEPENNWATEKLKML
ncbi:MAG: tetratricopeptide repeat protein [Lewinellaceae bacterium]|nr:tetratricopeptide repeat protein [Lewinellaceae bacterium]